MCLTHPSRLAVEKQGLTGGSAGSLFGHAEMKQMQPCPVLVFVEMAARPMWPNRQYHDLFVSQPGDRMVGGSDKPAVGCWMVQTLSF